MFEVTITKIAGMIPWLRNTRFGRQNHYEEELEDLQPHIQGSGVDKLYRICSRTPKPKKTPALPFKNAQELFRYVAQESEQHPLGMSDDFGGSTEQPE